MDRPTNPEIAAVLERAAELLEAQGASPPRAQAYREAGTAARRCERALCEVLAERGPPGLQEALGAGAGPAPASAVRELLDTGRLAMLDRLEGEVSPEDLFMTVPGMGEALARRSHAMLGLETLEDLEAAARDGRLKRVPGFGARRAALVHEAVVRRLAGSRRRWSRHPSPERPDPFPPPEVALLLAVDAEYRRQAVAGALPKIRPRRFNPKNEAWLPIWHTERDGWALTAMFSTTSGAHEPEAAGAGARVAISFERDGHEGQAMAGTASRGLMAGLRVVRGREAECQAHLDALHRAA